MMFSYFTMFVGIAISVISAYYSVMGLTTIFAAAFWPILIMGTALEIGKITASVWLKIYWKKANVVYKLYLVPAILVLMILTSMGIFGGLSKAHSDQSLVSGNVQAKIFMYDEKIRMARENIDANRRALKQLDDAVDQVMARSSDQNGADKAVAIRRSQQKERTRLISEIDIEQKKIIALNEESATIRGEIRKIENETGPIKYIAALIYGDNPDSALLERAVRWVTILIVIVFDPLAIMLILAAQNSFVWQREQKQREQAIADDVAAMSISMPDSAQTRPFTQEEVDALDEASTIMPEPEPKPEPVKESKPEPTFSQQFYTNESYTLNPAVINTTLKSSSVAESDDEIDSATLAQPVVENDTVEKVRFTDNLDYVVFEGKMTSIRALKVLRPDLVISQNDVNIPVINYGGKFPKEAVNGEYYIRTDYRPHVVYRFLNKKWILIDKEENIIYTQSREYIEFLIKQIERNEYDVQHLSVIEKNVISEHLSKV